MMKRGSAMDEQLVKSQFGRAAEGYVTSPGHAEGEDLERLVAWAALRPQEAALDVATGGGHVAGALAPFAREVVASDLTPEMLAAAERHLRGRGLANVSFREAAAEALPFEDARFDVVSCRIAPHHFRSIPAFLAEARRVLRPGGRLLLEDSVVPPGEAGDFLNRVERLRDPSHVRSLTEAEWREALAAAGFRVARAEAFAKRHLLAPWMERMQVPEPVQAEVRRAFREAPEAVRAAFQVGFDAAGEPVSYTDTKILFLAV